MKQILLSVLLCICLLAPACGFKLFGVDIGGKKDYQLAKMQTEKMENKATVQAGIGNKTIGQNTTNNSTELIIMIIASLIGIMILREILVSISRARHQKMIREILTKQADQAQERFNKLISAIYHNPELSVKQVRIMEDERI